MKPVLDNLYKKNIIIFPFSQDARYVADILLRYGFQVVSFWDNFQSETSYRNIPVKHPNNSEAKTHVVLLCARFSLEGILLRDLEQLQCSEVYFCSDILEQLELTHSEICATYEIVMQNKSRKRFKELQQQPNTLISNGYVLEITEKCSLRCKDCVALMPYFTSPKDANFNDTIADIHHLLNSLDYVHRIVLIGGEPFLCRELYRYVEYLVQCETVGIVYIVTNGTILPKDRNLTCLKSPKVMVQISDYGALSQNITSLIELLQKEHIIYQRHPQSGWTELNLYPHHRTPEEQEIIYKNCTQHSACQTIKDGRLFPCPFLAGAAALCAIPNVDDYSVSLTGKTAEQLREEIRTLQKRSYFQACDFCSGFSGDKTQIPAAIQAGAPISYTKYWE